MPALLRSCASLAILATFSPPVAACRAVSAAVRALLGGGACWAGELAVHVRAWTAFLAR